ncbi:methyl-accepting chemotaxis protein [Thermodesulfobacteriota bacterium]
MLNFFINNIQTPINGKSLNQFFKKIISGFSDPKKSLLDTFAKKLLLVHEDISGTSSMVEPDFIELGNKLQSFYSDSGRVSELAREAVKATSEKSEDNVFGRLDHLVSKSMAELNRQRQDFQYRLVQINHIAEKLNRLLQICDAGSIFARYLNAIGMNIRIEAARSEEYDGLFAVIYKESRHFSGIISDIVGEIQDIAQNTRTTLEDSSVHIGNKLAQLYRIEDQAKQQVKEAMQEIAQVLEFSKATLQESEERSQAITAEVGALVVGLQFHDNMSQRLLHINETINDIRKLVTGENQNDQDKSVSERAALAYHLLSLQINQLSQVKIEINSVQSMSKQALLDLAEEIVKLAENLSTLTSDINTNNDSSTNTNTRDCFFNLQSALINLQGNLDNGEDFAGQILKIARQSSESLIQLTTNIKRVEEIGFKTKLIALNAMVNAAHLGEKGMRFHVLADELRLLSVQAEDFVLQVEEQINAISSIDHEVSEKQNTESGIDKDELTTSINEISGLYSHFSNNIDEAVKGARLLSSGIGDTQNDLNFFADLERRLSGQMKAMDEISTELAPYAENKSTSIDAHMDKLAERYTMGQERILHDMHATEKTDSGGKPEDIIIPLEDGKSGTPSTSMSIQGDWVEWAKTEEEDKMELPKPDEEDLGDNVELF